MCPASATPTVASRGSRRMRPRPRRSHGSPSSSSAAARSRPVWKSGTRAGAAAAVASSRCRHRSPGASARNVQPEWKESEMTTIKTGTDTTQRVRDAMAKSGYAVEFTGAKFVGINPNGTEVHEIMYDNEDGLPETAPVYIDRDGKGEF